MAVNADSFAGSCALRPGKPAGSTIAPHMEGPMKKLMRTVLMAGAVAALLQAQAGMAVAAQCMQVGGVGMGVMEGFASFMAEAAMKNSAKARLGEAVKIGKVSKKCEWKTVSYECKARAQACR
jgi:hypothetical protein